MDNREREQLTQFLQQLVDARVGTKDAEADQLIQAALGRQADASYLLVQRALLLEQALQNSQASITRLQAELEQARPQRGFLSEPNAWGQAPAAVAVPPSSVAQAAAPWQAPGAAQTAWGGSLLGTVATTAAGVVAGSLLFRGLDNLMGHHGSPAAAASAAAPAAALAQAPAEEVAVNDVQDSSNDLDSLSLDSDNGWG